MANEKKEKKVGEIIHYYTNLKVAAAKLTDTLKVSDKIHIKGHTSDFTQTLDSMQIDHKDVNEAKKGDSIGLKISDHAREGDEILKVG
ncbi:MAG TPA: translation elongation factor-like protein [Patescibacteria group bacterium]|nr:translation elongation factor-like protein [Patescibacteria group bacterium]